MASSHLTTTFAPRWSDTRRPERCPGRTRAPWAHELGRPPHAVWAIDALRCPHCGGRISTRGAGAQLPTIHDPEAITAILAAVHSDKWTLPATGPPVRKPGLASAAACPSCAPRRGRRPHCVLRRGSALRHRRLRPEDHKPSLLEPAHPSRTATILCDAPLSAQVLDGLNSFVCPTHVFICLRRPRRTESRGLCDHFPPDALRRTLKIRPDGCWQGLAGDPEREIVGPVGKRGADRWELERLQIESTGCRKRD